MFLPTPMAVVVKALCVSTLVGCHARGLFYTLMENLLLLTCLVNAL